MYLFHRNILIEPTSSQKVCATSVCSGDQGGGQLAASVTEFDMKLTFFKKSIKNLNYALNHRCIGGPRYSRGLRSKEICTSNSKTANTKSNNDLKTGVPYLIFIFK